MWFGNPEHVALTMAMSDEPTQEGGAEGEQEQTLWTLVFRGEGSEGCRGLSGGQGARRRLRKAMSCKSSEAIVSGDSHGAIW